MNNDSYSRLISTFQKIHSDFPKMRLFEIIDDFNSFCYIHGLQPYYLTDEEYANQFEKYYDLLKWSEK